MAFCIRESQPFECIYSHFILTSWWLNLASILWIEVSMSIIQSTYCYIWYWGIHIPSYITSCILLAQLWETWSTHEAKTWFTGHRKYSTWQEPRQPREIWHKAFGRINKTKRVTTNWYCNCALWEIGKVLVLRPSHQSYMGWGCLRLQFEGRIYLYRQEQHLQPRRAECLQQPVLIYDRKSLTSPM